MVTAKDTTSDVEGAALWSGKVVTEIVPAGPYWEAEKEHQNYMERFSSSYTCHFIRPNWNLPQRAPER